MRLPLWSQGQKKELLGIYTDGDLRRSLQKEGAEALEKTMEDLMTKMPISVSRNLLALDAIKIMQNDPGKRVMVTPVVDQEQVVGVIRMHDIIQASVSK